MMNFNLDEVKKIDGEMKHYSDDMVRININLKNFWSELDENFRY